MITKTQAKQNNIKIVDRREIISKDKTALIEQLKVLLPNVINSDNQLDIRALNDVLDLANTTSNNQGYELTFAGKGIAKALADSASAVELKAETAQSKDFEDTDNVVIRGDNLHVLKILQANYHNKIKMIYIDPPYNTKKENFIYKDNFKQTEAELIEQFGMDEGSSDFLHDVYGTRSHSGWLSFIYPRLKLARELLADDGVIFISIDDNEQANLKIICDEIFGEDAFLVNLIWQTTKGAQGIVRENKVVTNHENILCYAKYKNRFSFNGLLRDEKEGFQNPDEDPKGLWKRQYLQRFGQGFKKRKIINPENSMVFEFETPYTEEKMNKWIENNEIIFPATNQKYPARKEYLSEYASNKQLVSSIGLFSTKADTEILYGLFEGKKVFNNPKPKSLVKFLVEQATTKNDTILDFFAGSGTTADAVMQLNFDDGGKRKFILVQIDEPIDETKYTAAHKFCTDSHLASVISSITIERLNRAGEKIKTDSVVTHDSHSDKTCPDIGYKVFNSTLKPQVAQQEDNDESVFAVENSRASTLDTLVNMLCATCKTLDSKIECLIKDKLYRADNEIYLLANVDSDQLEEYTDLKINLDGWADIDLQQYLNLGVGKRDNLTVVY